MSSSRPVPPPVPPPVGGRYRVLDRAGVGGIGEVWRVEDENLSRTLAAKVLRADRRTRDHAARLRREAVLTGRLQHPAVPPVVERGELPGAAGPFFTMKLVRGRTLRDLLRDRDAAAGDGSPNEPDAPGGDGRRGELLGVVRRVCEAVGYAHELGVIHRDLKPSNVMVGAHGEVQVMDWGMARVVRATADAGDWDESTFLAAGDDAAPLSADDATLPTPARTAPAGETVALPATRAGGPVGAGAGDAGRGAAGAGGGDAGDPLATLTRAGAGVGTPAYMPPEQARGEADAVDARSDVFGLGAVLFATLTGTAPFASGDSLSSFRLAAAGDVRDALAKLAACDADGEIKTLCRRCLSPDPADRPADGSAVAGALRDYERSVRDRLQAARADAAAAAVRAAEERKRRRVWAGLAATAAALALTVAGAGWRYAADRADRRAAAAVAAAATNPP